MFPKRKLDFALVNWEQNVILLSSVIIDTNETLSVLEKKYIKKLES